VDVMIVAVVAADAALDEVNIDNVLLLQEAHQSHKATSPSLLAMITSFLLEQSKVVFRYRFDSHSAYAYPSRSSEQDTVCWWCQVSVSTFEWFGILLIRSQDERK
jgi:hypothetical protein